MDMQGLCKNMPKPETKGFFEMRTAMDLFRKLKNDLDLLQSNPTDTYLAFNFFVTCEHMGEWVYPGDEAKSKREDLKRGEIILKVCSHIANGAKHFVLHDKRHNSVANTKRARRSWFPGKWWGTSYWGNWWGANGLIVELDGPAKEKLGSWVRADVLAGQLCVFWEEYLRNAEVVGELGFKCVDGSKGETPSPRCPH